MRHDPSAITDSDREIKFFCKLILYHVNVRNSTRREVSKRFRIPTKLPQALGSMTDFCARIDLDARLVEMAGTSCPLMDRVSSEGVGAAVTDSTQWMERNPNDGRKELVTKLFKRRARNAFKRDLSNFGVYGHRAPPVCELPTVTKDCRTSATERFNKLTT